MPRQKDNEILSIVHPNCCGLDVHKKFVSACLLTQEGGEVREEVREFFTFTDELYNLRSWLLDRGCPVAAIESTGVYWQPVHNILEEAVEVVLVNARHVKNVPGRKTDVSDAKWLAGLLRHGLLRGSFIPPKEIRQWRQLWSMRSGYLEALGDFKRRVHKHLQACNIKIDSVASSLFSVTGRNLMNLLLYDTEAITIEAVKACARGALKEKVEALYLSMRGFFGTGERYILGTYLDTIRILELQIDEITRRLQDIMSDHQEVLDRLDQIPGINEVGACGILSIVGPELSAFPSARHFCSWAGMCPGNNKSAGKRKNSRSPVKRHPLRTLLTELAWAGVRKQGSYYRDKFFRLKSRIGPKPAICAIAHRMAMAIYHMIAGPMDFKELGADYLDRFNEKAKLARLRSQAQRMGYSLTPRATP